MDGLRVDVWLWVARFFKTRSLARQAVEGGRISVNDSGCKPAKLLREHDRLEIGRGEERMVVDVLVLADKRGPASVASTMYEETSASCAAREAAREKLRLIGHSGPDHRPDKHARRQLRELKDSR